MGGGSGGSQTTSNAPWRGLQPYLTGGIAPGQGKVPGLLPEAARLYEQGISVPDFNQNQVQAQQGALDAAGTIEGQLGGVNQAFQSQLNATDLNNNPVINDYIQAAFNPIIQNFQDEIVPTLSTNALSAGQFGGTRHGIGEAIATDRLTRNLGDVSSGILNNAYTQGLEAQTRALALSPTVLSNNLLPAQIQGAIGDQQAAMQLQQENQEFTNLAAYANFLSGNFGGETTGPGPEGPSPMQGALGGAAMGYSMGGPWGAAAGALIGYLMT